MKTKTLWLAVDEDGRHAGWFKNEPTKINGKWEGDYYKLFVNGSKRNIKPAPGECKRVTLTVED